jgi:DNA polymerase elongation subunit (family B)
MSVAEHLHGKVICFDDLEKPFDYGGFPVRSNFLDSNFKKIVSSGVQQHREQYFFPNTFVEKVSWKNKKKVTNIYVCGVLIDGTDATVILQNINITFDVQVPKGIDETSFSYETKQMLTEHGVAIKDVQNFTGYPSRGFREKHEFEKYIRIYAYNTKDRKKAILLMKSMVYTKGDFSEEYILVNDDEAHHLRKVGREYKYNSADWNLIKNYAVDNSGTRAMTEYVFIMDIADFKATNADKENEKILAKDPSTVITWDIETYNPDSLLFDDLDSSNDRHPIFNIGMTYHWYHSTEALLRIGIVDKATTADPNKLTIVCKTELNLLKCMAKVIGFLKPEFMAGFNDGGFDWPYYITRCTKFNLLPFLMETTSKITMEKYQMNPEGILKFNRKSMHIKLENGLDSDNVFMNIPGIVMIDVRTAFRKKYPKEKKSGLNHFLKMHGLEGKVDMPIPLMFEYYRQCLSGKINMEKIREMGRSEVAGFDAEAFLKGVKELPNYMAQINDYCVVDAHRCQDLMVKLNLIPDMREMGVLAFCPVYDSLYYANGIKIRNLALSEAQSFNGRQLMFSNNYSNYKLPEKYPGAHVVEPERGLVPSSETSLIKFQDGTSIPGDKINTNWADKSLIIDFRALWNELGVQNYFQSLLSIENNIAQKLFTIPHKSILPLIELITNDPKVKELQTQKRAHLGTIVEEMYTAVASQDDDCIRQLKAQFITRYTVEHPGALFNHDELEGILESLSEKITEEIEEKQKKLYDSIDKTIHPIDMLSAEELYKMLKFGDGYAQWRPDDKFTPIMMDLMKMIIDPYKFDPEKFHMENHVPITSLDFSSLYPSIMMTYNLSKEMIVETKARRDELDNKGYILHHVLFPFGAANVEMWTIRWTEGLMCFDKDTYESWLTKGYIMEKVHIEFGKTDLSGWKIISHKNPEMIIKMGLYPTILENLFNRRSKMKKGTYKTIDVDGVSTRVLKSKGLKQYEKELEQLKKIKDTTSAKYKNVSFMYGLIDAKQGALKVFMNTFYGETGNSSSPFFILGIAGGITSAGQRNIKMVIKYLRDVLGCRIKYGDTDSVYWQAPVVSYYETQKKYYNEKMNLKQYKTALVRTTFDVTADFQNEVNKLLVADNGTRYLKMAYEEVLFPCSLNGKKKYSATQHIHAVIFNVPTYKDLFVKGQEWIKRTASEFLITTGTEPLMEAYNIYNRKTLIDIVYDYVKVIFDTEWNTNSFIKSAVYKPDKQNVPVQVFVARMVKENIHIKPGERFEYIVAKKVGGNVFRDSRGRKHEYKPGDKMELLSKAKRLDIRADMMYYIKGVIGQYARYVCYHPKFEADTDKRSVDLAARDLTIFCRQFDSSSIDTGSILKKTSNKVKKYVKERLAKEYDWTGEEITKDNIPNAEEYCGGNPSELIMKYLEVESGKFQTILIADAKKVALSEVCDDTYSREFLALFKKNCRKRKIKYDINKLFAMYASKGGLIDQRLIVLYAKEDSVIKLMSDYSRDMSVICNDANFTYEQLAFQLRDKLQLNNLDPSKPAPDFEALWVPAYELTDTNVQDMTDDAKLSASTAKREVVNVIYDLYKSLIAVYMTQNEAISLKKYLDFVKESMSTGTKSVRPPTHNQQEFNDLVYASWKEASIDDICIF